MKSKLLLSIPIFLAFIMLYSQIQTRSTGAPAGRVNDPLSELTCQNGCHSTNALNAGGGLVSISTNIPAEGYQPESTYTVTARIEESGFPRFGFQVLAFGSAVNDGVGTVTLTDDTRTQIMATGERDYVTHRSGGIDSISSNTWTFDWTAPDTSLGEVVFYGAFVAANGNGSNQGDWVYSTTDTIQEAGTATPLLEDILGGFSIVHSPFDKQIGVAFTNFSVMDLHIGISDLQGRTVYSSSEVVGAGSFSRNIQSDWDTGIYLITLRSSRGIHHQKILIQNI